MQKIKERGNLGAFELCSQTRYNVYVISDLRYMLLNQAFSVVALLILKFNLRIINKIIVRRKKQMKD